MSDLHSVEATGRAFPGGGAFPVHVFRVDDIGIDADAFVRDVRPSFERTAWDEYDVANRRVQYVRNELDEIPSDELAAIEENLNGRARIAQIAALIERLPREHRVRIRTIQPHRRRALRKYEVSEAGKDRWRIQPHGDGSFNQAVSDFRARTREFQLVEPEITYHPGILALIASAAETARTYQSGMTKLDVALHQMTVIARPRQAGHPAPEGLHQDGCDFIVSALIVERSRVSGAMSRVRNGRDGDPILEIELGQGQGIFQADSGTPLWHEVSPIDLQPGATLGHRMTFGLDLNRC